MEAITAGLAEYHEPHPDVVWVELDPASVEAAVPQKKRGKPTRARTQPLRIVRNDFLDVERVAFSCRCWRCRAGGVAVSDMGALDQILARHLLRMPEVERDARLREWGVNPKHGPREQQKLAAWMAIEKGAKVSAPAYAVRASL